MVALRTHLRIRPLRRHGTGPISEHRRYKKLIPAQKNGPDGHRPEAIGSAVHLPIGRVTSLASHRVPVLYGVTHEFSMNGDEWCGADLSIRDSTFGETYRGTYRPQAKTRQVFFKMRICELTLSAMPLRNQVG